VALEQVLVARQRRAQHVGLQHVEEHPRVDEGKSARLKRVRRRALEAVEQLLVGRVDAREQTGQRRFEVVRAARLQIFGARLDLVHAHLLQLHLARHLGAVLGFCPLLLLHLAAHVLHDHLCVGFLAHHLALQLRLFCLELLNAIREV